MIMDPGKKSWDFRAAARTASAALVVDPLAKVVCLALAFMLWMYIVGSAEVQFEFHGVPVEFVDVASHLAVSEDSDRHLSLRVSGPKNSISSIDATDFKVVASLAGERKGEKRVSISLENVASPRPDVKVERIDPGTLMVFLEPVSARRLPVAPKLQGEVPAGFRVTARSRPETAMVMGPANVFESISAVSTEIIDISGRRATFNINAKLVKEMRSIQKIDPDVVDVLVEIEETLIEKLLEGVRVELQNPIPGRSVQIKPELVAVKLRGPQNVLERLESQSIRVQVVLPPDKQFHLAVPLALGVPERVEIISYEPALVRVSIPGQ